MAAGDFYVRRNNALTSAVPNAGTNLDADWDSIARSNGSIVTYSNPNFQLDTGLYLVMYSERFSTSDTTNNERIEIQGEIHISGTGAVGGYGQDFIRKSSGQQECVVSGYDIVDITSDNTDLFIRFYRTDNSTTGTVTRDAGFGSVIILQLDDNHNYGFYSTSASEATSGTTERTLNINTNDRQDTGFSRSGTAVDVATAGRYLITYNLDISQTATGREDIVGRLTNGGTELVGSNSYCYMRGADGCQDGALAGIGIFDLPAGADIDVRWQAPQSATITAAAGATLKLWQIPSGADEAIMEATNGAYNTNVDFAFDTLPHIDTGSFTATAGNSNIDVDQSDYVLAFSTLHQNAADTPQRAYPLHRFKVNEAVSNTAAGGVYHRNSGGSGVVAVTVTDLLQVAPNDSIEVRSDVLGASGTLNNDSAQFSVLSLESIFGPYTFPPVVTDFNTTESFIWGAENLVITGSNFEALQGTGKVEFWDDQVGTTKTVQTIDSWSDTSIQIDTVQGSLPNDTTIYLVVTADSGGESAPLAVNVGLIPYHDLIVNTLNADHYWRLNNTYDDTGDTGPVRNMTSGIVGTHTFSSTAISDSNTHSYNMNSVTNRREIADSENMNVTITSAERTISCWFQTNINQHPLAAIWKEGGGVQNLAILMGYGGVIMWQLADIAGTRDNVQAWSDFKITPGRPYNIVGRYSNSENPAESRLYIDGVLQTDTDGNPMTINIFDSHSGDVVWGDPDNNLETGATDISYNGPEDAQLSDFATWSDNSGGTNAGGLDPTTEIRDILFRRGAVPDDTITSDTEANMQTDIDGTADTRPDWPLSYRIEPPSAGSDLELTLTDKTFNDRITSHLEWRGGGTLTIVNGVNSNFDSSKAWSATGGTITVVEQVNLTITVLDIVDNSVIENARVRMTADTGGPETVGTVLLEGLTNSSGQLTGTYRYSSDQPVDGRIRKGSTSTYYKTSNIVGTIASSGIDLTIFMIRDE